jgi:hypothetical protein
MIVVWMSNETNGIDFMHVSSRELFAELNRFVLTACSFRVTIGTSKWIAESSDA